MSGFPNTTEIAIKLLIAFNGFDSVLYSPFTPSLDHRQSFLTVNSPPAAFSKPTTPKQPMAWMKPKKNKGKNVRRFFSNLSRSNVKRATVQPG
jgi:hypothetical protein